MTLHPLDDVWMRIECDDAVARELSDYFTFESPNAKFLQRKQQYRHWDGRIRLFKLKTRMLYRGLQDRVLEFAEQRGYEIDNLIPAPAPLYPVQELDAFIKNEQLPFQPHSYQYAALREALNNHRNIILSPTGSGKSFIIYLLQKMLGGRTLIVVPTIGLVTQMTNDFKDYGGDVNEIHQIQGGRSKDSNRRIFVSTWQSIYEQDAEWFQQFDTVIVDEVHLAKAKSLTHLMEQCTSVAYRFGFTGTLDETPAHRLILEGLFGPAIRVATTNDLMKMNKLAPLRVKMVVLKYPEQACRLMKKTQYQDEIDYVVQDLARLAFVQQMTKTLKGNALILFNFIDKHGLPMYELIKKNCPDKEVHYIAGSVGGEDRERIRQIVEHGENQVVVASYGTFSTGVNITNLRYIVFASPSKSKIRVLQSIGRGLRLHEDKAHCTLVDIVDDLRVGKHVNYLMKHAEERMRFYSTEKFPVTLHEIRLANLALKASGDAPDDVAA